MCYTTLDLRPGSDPDELAAVGAGGLPHPGGLPRIRGDLLRGAEAAGEGGGQVSATSRKSNRIFN